MVRFCMDLNVQNKMYQGPEQEAATRVAFHFAFVIWDVLKAYSVVFWDEKMQMKWLVANLGKY